jgi:phage tail sheath protein FI
MSFTVSYPGVYIQELPADVRTIVGVPTSVTAFIGRTLRGPTDEPVRIFSFADFDRQFGGLWEASTLSFAVQHYFLNGGADAVIVRVHNPTVAGDPAGDTASTPLGGALTISAASPGAWGNQLRVTIDHDTRDQADPAIGPNQFNILAAEVDPNNPTVAVAEERFLNVSVDPASPRFVELVLEQESNFIRADGAAAGNRPLEMTDPLAGGSNGNPITFDQIADPGLQDPKQGLWALEKTDIFNLLCIPPLTPADEVTKPIWDEALAFCKGRRAMLLVDPPAVWNEPADVFNAGIGLDTVVTRDENAALFFPRIRAANPLKENRIETFAPCGAVAGVFARVDASRGVWKAPAGQETALFGVRELDVKLTDQENGLLNPQGINCLRTFPVAGRVVWGARTLEGADQLASQWKYIPVRRLALYIEETLYRNTGWVVFEPNDEPLWSQIRLSIGSFMQNLFRQGAFQGSTPRDAYLVKCDKDTTTQTDIDSGIVNIIVGFAPLKPAEFVIIKIRQLAGQVAA